MSRDSFSYEVRDGAAILRVGVLLAGTSHVVGGLPRDR